MERAETLAALARDRTIDVTTTGAKSGTPRRIEIRAWVDGDTLFLTGSPGRREVREREGEPGADDPPQARRPSRRLRPGRGRRGPGRAACVLSRVASGYDVEAWIAGSPLVEVEFP